MTDRDDSLISILRRFRLGGELRPLVCTAATFAAAAMLAGLGAAVAYFVGLARSNPFPGSMGLVRGDVRESDIALGFTVAGILWLVALPFLWRPAVRLTRHSLSAESRRRWGTPLAITVIIGGAITVLTYVIYRLPWDDAYWLVVAISLLGGGAAIVSWLPAVFRLEQGRPVTGPGGRVNVHCPQCGYSMVGLHQAKCPECGRSYTIDELILAQRYPGDGGNTDQKRAK